jgi:hypothetical protein
VAESLHASNALEEAQAVLAEGLRRKPDWAAAHLLDRYDNCWRWLSGRMDSPWYPSLRIFRQKRLGDWGPVITRVAAALSRMASEHAAGRCHPSPAPECQDAA